MKAPMLCLMLLTGCATGVVMNDDDRASCKKSGCTAWTLGELRALAEQAYRQGFGAGLRQRGRSI